ncbi:MAG: hypothetical protein WBP41_12715 [Saprospiraceae bacterium]
MTNGVQQLKERLHLEGEFNGDITAIDRFVVEYFLPLQEIIDKFYWDKSDRNFEGDIYGFYQSLQEFPNDDSKIPIKGILIQYFVGVCLLILGKYKESFSKFIQLRECVENNNINLLENVLKIIFTYFNKIKVVDSVLVLVGKGTAPDEGYNSAEIKQILKLEDIYDNLNFEVIPTDKFKDLDELLDKTFKYSQVHFVGHGNEYFRATLQNNLSEPLTADYICQYYLENQKIPKLMTFLCCSYAKYVSLAKSELFDYVILSENGNIKSSEIFIKTFLKSYNFNKDIQASFYFSQIALTCVNSGSNQIVLFGKYTDV